MSGVCGLSVLETHRISRATRTANVMSLFVFCESRGGRRTTLSPIITLVSYLLGFPTRFSSLHTRCACPNALGLIFCLFTHVKEAGQAQRTR